MMNSGPPNQVMGFTDEQIRAIVKLAQYPDRDAERYIARTLIARLYPCASP
jgi:hypothetical protein